MNSRNRRGEKLDNLTEDEALDRIVNKAKFRTGQTKERRRMTNPIKETWLFVEADGNHNKLGKAMLSAFSSVYKSKSKEPTYNDVFDKFWSSVGKDIPQRNKKNGDLFTELDWKKKGQTFLKGYITKGMKQRGEKASTRVALLLKSGRGSQTLKQREEAASFLEGLGAFTGEPYTEGLGKVISREEAIRLGSVEARQTNLI